MIREEVERALGSFDSETAHASTSLLDINGAGWEKMERHESVH